MEQKIKRVDEMEEKINKLQKTIDQQNKTIAEQETTISTHKSKFEGLSEPISNFKQILDAGINSIKISVDNKIKDAVDKLNSKIDTEVNSLCDALEQDQQKKDVNDKEMVAFKKSLTDGLNSMNNLQKYVDNEVKIIIPKITSINKSINSVASRVVSLENKIANNTQ